MFIQETTNLCNSYLNGFTEIADKNNTRAKTVLAAIKIFTYFASLALLPAIAWGIRKICECYTPIPPIPGFTPTPGVFQYAPSVSALLEDLGKNIGKQSRVDLTKYNGIRISIYNAEPFNSNDQIDYTSNHTVMLKGYTDSSKRQPFSIKVSEIQQIEGFELVV